MSRELSGPELPSSSRCRAGSSRCRGASACARGSRSPAAPARCRPRSLIGRTSALCSNNVRSCSSACWRSVGPVRRAEAAPGDEVGAGRDRPRSVDLQQGQLPHDREQLGRPRCVEEPCAHGDAPGLRLCEPVHGAEGFSPLVAVALARNWAGSGETACLERRGLRPCRLEDSTTSGPISVDSMSTGIGAPVRIASLARAVLLRRGQQMMSSSSSVPARCLARAASALRAGRKQRIRPRGGRDTMARAGRRSSPPCSADELGTDVRTHRCVLRTARRHAPRSLADVAVEIEDLQLHAAHGILTRGRRRPKRLALVPCAVSSLGILAAWQALHPDWDGQRGLVLRGRGRRTAAADRPICAAEPSIDALAADRETVIVLTCAWHERDAPAPSRGGSANGVRARRRKKAT